MPDRRQGIERAAGAVPSGYAPAGYRDYRHQNAGHGRNYLHEDSHEKRMHGELYSPDEFGRVFSGQGSAAFRGDRLSGKAGTQ